MAHIQIKLYLESNLDHYPSEVTTPSQALQFELNELDKGNITLSELAEWSYNFEARVVEQ